MLTEDESERESLFAPGGANSYAGSEEERTRRRPKPANLSVHSSPTALEAQIFDKSEGILCSHEWRGYQNPTDVLQPFGYTESFVQLILGMAQREAQSRKADQTEKDETKTPSKKTPPTKPEHETTCAVRGATFARPEGYCLCCDKDSDAARNEAYEEDWVDGWERLLRQSELNGSRIYGYYRQRKWQHQRDVMPCVVLSTPQKCPLNGTIETTQQPCIQFLNATRSHAVRLFTLPFQCGPLNGPVTILCVGIATEDGCFVSGLTRRFELGHMYPSTAQEDLVDMSAVCIATDQRNIEIENTASNSIPGPPSRSASVSGRASINHMDDDSSSCTEDGEQSVTNCTCPFNSIGDRGDDEDDPTREEDIFRGQRGPGFWHCYVGIFDGDKSEIRIDGVPERPENPHRRHRGTPILGLDGLTIGSDHSFDMSLCLGEGSDGAGEGAIAELIVFKGRLCQEDLERLEQKLMTKHGLVKSTDRLTSEDQWRRESRALISQPSPWTMVKTKGVPLRVVAKDRSVAWHRMNAVTGKMMKVSRIGSKFSTGSSDW